MINLICTNCRATLNIDDAFAGGVCRCKHCGTIQTVPSRLKSSASNSGKSESSGSRTLYRRGGSSDPQTGSGTGLDDLANIVASSGLLGSGSGLTSSRLRRSSANPDDPRTRPRSLAPYLVAAGIVIVVLLAIVLWMSFSRATKPAATSNIINDLPTASDQPAAAGASFCGIRLDGAVVVYVIDRGNGTRDMFDTLKEVTYRSIESLGGDRKFQVIFWSNGEGADVAFPSQPRYASKENLAACKRVLDDVSAFGQTDARSALKQAFANQPDVVIIATGKSLELDQSFAQEVMAARKTSSAKIDTIALGESNSSILKDIATRTGGEYQTVSAARLRTFAD